MTRPNAPHAPNWAVFLVAAIGLFCAFWIIYMQKAVIDDDANEIASLTSQQAMCLEPRYAPPLFLEGL